MIAASVKSDVIVFLTGRSVTANLHCDLLLHYWTLIVASVCLIEGHECGRARSCVCVRVCDDYFSPPVLSIRCPQ